MNIAWIKRTTVGASLLAALLVFCGCSSVLVNTHAYLGSPRCAPTKPETVQIFASEPTNQPKELLGEVILSLDGRPSRDKVENKLKTAAAKLGATGVFIVSDRTHIYPLMYWDYWGPVPSEVWRRLIVGVAFKNK
jgi:hypothetical protein